eukprot:624157-Hanusia_phi.AAC.1
MKESIARSLAEKSEGNEHFKQGRVEAALKCYRRALDAVSCDLSKAGGEMRLSCHLNAALCMIKLEKPREALSECNLALRVDGRSVKALFRRSKAYFGLGEYERAKEDVDRMLELEPQDQEGRELSSFISNVIQGHLNFNDTMRLFEEGDMARASQNLERIASTARKIGAFKVAAHAESYRGIAMQMQNRLEEALSCHQRHAKLAEGLGDKSETMRALSNLGRSVACLRSHVVLVTRKKRVPDAGKEPRGCRVLRGTGEDSGRQDEQVGCLLVAWKPGDFLQVTPPSFVPPPSSLPLSPSSLSLPPPSSLPLSPSSLLPPPSSLLPPLVSAGPYGDHEEEGNDSSSYLRALGEYEKSLESLTGQERGGQREDLGGQRREGGSGGGGGIEGGRRSRAGAGSRRRSDESGAGQREAEAKGYSHIASTHFESGDFVHALAAYRKSFEIFK